MDYKNIRMYPIPHFSKYLISKEGLLLSREELTQIKIEYQKRGFGPYVRVEDDLGKIHEAPLVALFMICFYGWVPLEIKHKFPIKIYGNDVDGISLDNLYYDITPFMDIEELTDTIWINNDEFRRIPGYEEILYINKDGAIFSYNFKRFKTRAYSSRDPYSLVSLASINKSRTAGVHRLVAKAFLDDFDSELFVNHKDGHKYNSYYDNLEMVTPRENTLHAIRTGLVTHCKSISEIRALCQLLEQHKTLSEIRKELKWYGVRNDSLIHLIYNITSGNQWSDISKDYDLSDYNLLKLNYHRKYSDEQIKSICALLEENPSLSNKEIASKTQTNSSLVQNIRCGSQWKHISKDYNIEYEQGKRNFTKSEIDMIFDLAEQNIGPTEIGKKFSPVASAGTIVQVLQGASKYAREVIEKRNFQYRARRRPTPEHIVHDICKMHQDGYRDFEINAKYPELFHQTINDITTGKNFTHISSQYGIEKSH